MRWHRRAATSADLGKAGAQGSTGPKRDDSVYLAPSPHGVAQGYDLSVDEGEVILHSHTSTVTATHFLGFEIADESLVLFDKSLGAWLPWISLAGMPEGVWVRFANGKGVPVIPVELRRDPGGFSGRWLDQAGGLLPLGTLDAVRGPGGASVLEAEYARHNEFMDSWRRFGGWRLEGARWYPPTG